MKPEHLAALDADDVELLHWALVNLESVVCADQHTCGKWFDRCYQARVMLFDELRRRRVVHSERT